MRKDLEVGNSTRGQKNDKILSVQEVAKDQETEEGIFGNRVGAEHNTK